jgi:hypothetical protein
LTRPLPTFAGIACSNSPLLNTLWFDWYNTSAYFDPTNVASFAECCALCTAAQPACNRFGYWPNSASDLNCRLFSPANNSAASVPVLLAESSYSERLYARRMGGRLRPFLGPHHCGAPTLSSTRPAAQ